MNLLPRTNPHAWGLKSQSHWPCVYCSIRLLQGTDPGRRPKLEFTSTFGCLPHFPHASDVSTQSSTECPWDLLSCSALGTVSKRGAIYVTYHHLCLTGPSCLCSWLPVAKTGKEPFLFAWTSGFPAGPSAPPELAQSWKQTKPCWLSPQRVPWRQDRQQPVPSLSLCSSQACSLPGP